jgi:hypothetical protein
MGCNLPVFLRDHVTYDMQNFQSAVACIANLLCPVTTRSLGLQSPRKSGLLKYQQARLIYLTGLPKGPFGPKQDVSHNNYICARLHYPAYFVDWAGRAARAGAFP